MGALKRADAPGAGSVKVGTVLHYQERYRHNGDWRTAKVTGETKGTWLLAGGDVINKKTLCTRAGRNDYGQRFYTKQEKADKLFVESNRYGVARRVEVLQLNDVDMLEQIMEVLGMEPKE
jgi:hypothetical protein